MTSYKFWSTLGLIMASLGTIAGISLMFSPAPSPVFLYVGFFGAIINFIIVIAIIALRIHIQQSGEKQ